MLSTNLVPFTKHLSKEWKKVVTEEPLDWIFLKFALELLEEKYIKSK